MITAGVAADSDGNYWIAAADVAGSTYGIKSYRVENSSQPRNVGVQDRNDYMRISVFAGQMYLLASTAFGGNGAVYRLNGKPLPSAPMTRPSTPLFSYAREDAQDMDIESASSIWLGTRSGLYNYRFNGSEWRQVVAATSIVEIVGVGVSTDASTVYVSSASVSSSAVYAFDIETGAYTNNGQPILRAPPGYQYRGAFE